MTEGTGGQAGPATEREVAGVLNHLALHGYGMRAPAARRMAEEAGRLEAEQDALAARVASLEAERQAVAPLVAAVRRWHQAMDAAMAQEAAWMEVPMESEEGKRRHDAYFPLAEVVQDCLNDLQDAYRAYAARAGQGGEGA